MAFSSSRRDFRHPPVPHNVISYRRALLLNAISCFLTMYCTMMFVSSPNFGQDSMTATLASQAMELKKVTRQLEACESREKASLQELASSRRHEPPASSSTPAISGNAPCPQCPQCPPHASPSSKPNYGQTTWKSQELLSIGSILDTSYGFDLGTPPLKGYRGDEEAMVLFHGGAEPSSPGSADPLENCLELDVVITKRAEKNHCLLVMEHYQAYHLHRFMRLPPEKKGGGKSGAAELKFPLRRVGRGMVKDGADNFAAPKLSDSKKHWEKLQLFLDHNPAQLDRLAPLLQKIHRNNAVVVMVVNAGMVELLSNFVCAARARGIDTGSIIVFATDLEAKKVTGDLGLAVFYDEEGGFGNLPTDEAKSYGDATFVAMMYAKVLAVYLPMMLGYDVLFQDVDIVWHEDPLPYFQDVGRAGDFDTYFSDDGARSLRYAPFSANSGFYYLRNNDRTVYMMTSLLYAGDSIIKTHSHQQTFISLITEHNSLYGLSIKVLNTEEFPGGKQYHHDREYMLKWMNGGIASGTVKPIMYHMCWTANKDDKLLYMQQMGEWFLKEECGGKSIREGEKASTDCCAAEPVVTCHFKDKPSVPECKGQSMGDRDKGGRQFWP
jgi:hypothetical protein